MWKMRAIHDDIRSFAEIMQAILSQDTDTSSRYLWSISEQCKEMVQEEAVSPVYGPKGLNRGNTT